MIPNELRIEFLQGGAAECGAQESFRQGRYHPDVQQFCKTRGFGLTALVTAYVEPS
jgi:hypothetical protein